MPNDDETYLYVRANVQLDGELVFEYKLVGKPAQRMKHDENVSGWSEKDIEDLTRRILDVDKHIKVEVRYV